MCACKHSDSHKTFIQVHLKKLNMVKKLFQKVKLSNILDSLHVK